MTVRSLVIAGITILSTVAITTNESRAQEPYLGEIRMFAGNFAPRGWANCDGQMLPIAQHSALFSLLGTMYGGDGRTTFAVPDLRGRVPIHVGTGPGLSAKRQGQKGGEETTNLPRKVADYSERGVAATASAARLAQPINNMQPYLGVRFIIATEGTFPSRN